MPRLVKIRQAFFVTSPASQVPPARISIQDVADWQTGSSQRQSYYSVSATPQIDHCNSSQQDHTTGSATNQSVVDFPTDCTFETPGFRDLKITSSPLIGQIFPGCFPYLSMLKT